jgi:hypothetical protein
LLAFPRSRHSATADSEQENNQETSDKLQIPQADPGKTGKKVIDHMRDKYTKIDIKLNHNFMDINTNRARYNEHMTPPESVLRVEQ